jgi:uncharacterized flavoprotein (TIGR03862 family)
VTQHGVRRWQPSPIECYDIRIVSGTITPHIAVIGAGPAGLMAADVLARAGAKVTVYDRMASAGRKFLIAGRGGLNLTHSEALETFLIRYGAAMPHLRAAIEALPPAAVRAWCEGLHQPTFVGTSGRVFPKSFKTSPLLRSWLRRLAAAGVSFKFHHHWRGWDDHGQLLFETSEGRVALAANATVLALGGASWPRLGSDGDWFEVLRQAGVAVAPLKPSNCGFVADWSDKFRDRFEGQPLKRIALKFGGHSLGEHVVRGEATITRTGLEGGGIYALSALLRDAIDEDGEAVLYIALRPDLSAAELAQRLAAPRGKQSLSTFLRKAANLWPPAIGLLHEVTMASPVRLADMTPQALAELINAVPVRLTAAAPLATAISTAGGVRFDQIDDNFMLRHRRGVFVAGEMLDWEAPTGGYLLQASLSTGAAAGRGVLAWLGLDR